jgi:phosphoribosyl 1,2-cyclic phosphodiesterase
MSVSVSVLASGSRGNCALVQTSTTRILVDVGISCRETFRRMKALGDDPRSLTAIVITHEHSDHVYGLQVLARKLKLPVFMTGATHQTWARALRDENGVRPSLERLEIFASGKSFQTTRPIPWASPSAPKASRSALPPIWDTSRPACVIICSAAKCWSWSRITT